MKKLLFNWLWLVLLPAFNAWAADGDVWLEPAPTTVAPNTAFGLKLRVDSGTDKLGAYGVKVLFDPTLLQVDTSTTTSAITNGTNALGSNVYNANISGELNIAGVQAQGVGPGIDLRPLTINFKSLGTNGTATVELVVRDLTTAGGYTIGDATPRDGFGSTVTIGSAAPDFTITNITLTPASPIANGTFSAAVAVKNQGIAAGDGGTLSVWANQATAQTCGASGDRYYAVGALAAGASKTITLTGISSGVAGAKTFRAFVDSNCSTVESNEGNNQLTKTYTSEGNVVNAPTVTTNAASNITQTSATLNGSVLSNGATTTVSFDFGPTTAYGQSIAATPGTVYSSSAVAVSASKTGLTCGTTYHYRVKAANSVGASSGLDNIFVTAVCTNKPDFVITSVTLTPATPAANGTFSAAVTVKNQGTAAGNAGFVDVWTDQATVQTCGALSDNWVSVDILAAGASTTVTLNGFSVGVAGTKTFRAFVDSWCETVESNEANNQLTKAYTVGDAYFNFNVTKAGTGTGYVYSSDYSIDCGSTCSASLTGEITLNASADTGSNFIGWSGDADCSDGVVTMNADKNCIATFNLVIPSYTVTPSVGTGGTVSPSTAQTVTGGSKINFTVTPNSGYNRNSAVGGNCPSGTWAGNVWTTGNIIANCSVSFGFTPIPINGVCGSSNNNSFNTAPSTNLCSTGTVSGFSGTGPWNWSCAGTNGGSNASCTANINRYTATATAGTGGTVNSSNATVNYGTKASFTVTANSGYTRDNAVGGNCPAGTWSGNVWTTGNIIANCSVSFSFTPIVNGVCGTANGGTFSTAPAANLLCSTGNASAITGTGPWNWNCAGSNGGTTANCSANISVTSYTVTASANPLAGGSFIADPNTATVTAGATKSFIVTANAAYITNQAVAGTCPQGSWGGINNNVWTTGPITFDCNVIFGFTAVNAWLNPPNQIVIPEQPFTLAITVKSTSVKVGQYSFTLTFDPSKLGLDITYAGTNCTVGICPGANALATLSPPQVNFNTITLRGTDLQGVGPGNDLQLLVIHFKPIFITEAPSFVTGVALKTNYLETIGGNNIGLGARGATVVVRSGLCGDADGSAWVNIVDALAIARKVVGLPPPPTVEDVLADVNEDGRVGITDALHIARYSIGFVTPPEVCKIGQPF